MGLLTFVHTGSSVSDRRDGGDVGRLGGLYESMCLLRTALVSEHYRLKCWVMENECCMLRGVRCKVGVVNFVG